MEHLKSKSLKVLGSARDSSSTNDIKEFYTPDEVRKFTEEELNNPKLMKAVELSMSKWGKSSY